MNYTVAGGERHFRRKPGPYSVRLSTSSLPVSHGVAQDLIPCAQLHASLDLNIVGEGGGCISVEPERIY